MTEARPPLPPSTPGTAVEKLGAAEDGWNSCDPERVSLAYTPDSFWRTCAEFVHGRPAIAGPAYPTTGGPPGTWRAWTIAGRRRIKPKRRNATPTHHDLIHEFAALFRSLEASFNSEELRCFRLLRDIVADRSPFSTGLRHCIRHPVKNATLKVVKGAPHGMRMKRKHEVNADMLHLSTTTGRADVDGGHDLHDSAIDHSGGRTVWYPAGHSAGTEHDHANFGKDGAPTT